MWLYHRFTGSLRDVEQVLTERGVLVSYETIRQWCAHFGPIYAHKLRKRQGRGGDVWYLDEVSIVIGGQRRYLWRAVDQDGDVIDILVQKSLGAWLRPAVNFRRVIVPFSKTLGMIWDIDTQSAHS